LFKKAGGGRSESQMQQSEPEKNSLCRLINKRAARALASFIKRSFNHNLLQACKCWKIRFADYSLKEKST